MDLWRACMSNELEIRGKGYQEYLISKYFQIFPYFSL